MNCRNIWQPALSMLPSRLRHNVAMKDYTTMGVGGPALVLALPQSVDELAAVLKVCRDNAFDYYIIGAGSNLVFLDEGYQGVVIKLSTAFAQIDFSENIVKAGAALKLSQLVESATEGSLSGLECLAGIPGTVGGAVWMNAGSFGQSVSDSIHALSFLSREGIRHRLSASELSFSYRRLNGLPSGAVIVEAEFSLKEKNKGEIRDLIKKNLEIRSLRHPKGQRSAGSVFKNPENEPAGKIIENLGLKGLKIGGAQVSEKHGNFIINPNSDASGSDILSLLHKIINEVKDKRGIVLEPEVKIIGLKGEVEVYEHLK